MTITRLLCALIAIQQTFAAPIVERNRMNRRTSDYAPKEPLPKGYILDVCLPNLNFMPNFLTASQPDLQNTRCDTNFCAGTLDSGDAAFVCGDARLGPIVLPSCLPLTSLISSSTNYSRFGGLCPGEFLAAYTDYAAHGTAGWFWYPFADGFANNTAGVPIRGRMTLKPGTLIDRFGSVSGSFVAPAGSPYDQRALPPANLNWAKGNGMQVPFNYHVYEVQKPVVVVGGPVTPWFGQPGLGMQFQLPTSIKALLESGVMEEVPVEEKCVVGGGIERA